MRFLSLAITMCLAVLPVKGAALDMGPLSQYIQTGAQGSWEIFDEGGAAIFRNQRGEGDITFYYVGSPPEVEGRREITVNMGVIEGDDSSQAGLIYGYQENPRSYFIFTVSGTGTVRLNERTPQGWEERMSSTIGGLDPSNVTLSIIENGNEISLLVNGRGGTSIGNDRIGRGGVGIVAAGIGTYGFKGFDVSTRDGSRLQQQGTTEESRATAQSSVRPGDPNALPDGVLHVRPAEVIDTKGFGRPLQAASMLIPADWSFEGTVHWVLEGCFQGTHVVFDAVSKDQKTNISQLPTTTVQWSQIGPINNCTFLRAVQAEDLLQPVMDQVMQNTKIISTERHPGLTEMNRRTAIQDAGFAAWSDHIGATVDHIRHGEPHRAYVMLFTNHTQMIMPMLDGPSESVIAAARPIIYSAPVDQYEKNSVPLQVLMSTFAEGQEWAQEMARHRAKMSRDNLESSRRIGEISQQAQQEIAAINSGTQAIISGANDRNHRRTLEMLTETQTVQSSQGQVRLPAGNAWETGDGSIFVSTNPQFNPEDWGVTAKRLNPIR